MGGRLRRQAIAVLSGLLTADVSMGLRRRTYLAFAAAALPVLLAVAATSAQGRTTEEEIVTATGLIASERVDEADANVTRLPQADPPAHSLARRSPGSPDTSR